MDLTLIGGALTSVKAIIDIAKTLDDQKIVSVINSAVADVQVKLIATQQQVIQTQEENQSLRAEIRDLKVANDIEKSVVSHDGAIWRKLADGDEDGPYCARCWGLNKKLLYPTFNWVADGIASLSCQHHDKAHHFRLPAQMARRLGTPLK